MFLIAVSTSILLYKNNILKLDRNNLLILKNTELKELKHQTELNFLKAQVQPHFFFNTLTILNTLILEKSEKAKEIVLKLSDLMHYSIYEAKKENVSIWDEINSIQNYLEIEGLYKGQHTPAIEINGNIDQVKVPPLLYLSFIENCCNSNSIRDKNIELSISFSNLNSEHLLFNIKYAVNASKSKNKVGIKKIKRRLNLIYKNNYLLVTKNTKNTFSISLKTPINSIKKGF